MTQKERLVELLKTVPTTMGGVIDMETVAKYADEIIDIEQIADHLLSNGVIVPPCKVGDTVYVLLKDGSIQDHVIDEIDIKKDGFYVWAGIASASEKDFETTVFLTREEAEKAIKERLE